MSAEPYVGITGVTTVKQAKYICELFSEKGYSMTSSHIPMLGILVNNNTLNRDPISNRRYANIDDISRILNATKGQVLNMIHYYSSDLDTLSDQVDKLFREIYKKNLCKSMQLNIPWPDVHQLKKIKKQYPDMKIVFQASEEVISTERTPKDLALRIKKYKNLIDYVLIDPSSGRGKEFDLGSSVEIYLELRERCKDLTIGFAGGFTGKNVIERTANIIRRIGENNFCIDSEGGLREKIGSGQGNDLPNINKMREYLQAASLVLNKADYGSLEKGQ